MLDFSDMPAYTSNPRPFDWLLKEDCEALQVPTDTLGAGDFPDLVVCMMLYQLNRKAMYINYMAGAKHLFRTFFGLDCSGKLKETAPDWSEEVTVAVSKIRSAKDWTPAYEIQRLWLATKIHWSWLELAWLEAERMILKSGKAWQLERLERYV